MARDDMRYKAVICPNCGAIQATGAMGCSKCHTCNKSWNHYRKGKSVGVLREFDNPLAASDFVKAWKKQRAMEQGISIRKGANYVNVKA